jgi:hypothetical protein
MLRKTIYILLMIYSLISCEEVYYPSMKDAGGQLMVDALVTNDLTQSYVRLSRSTSFYDLGEPASVTGASVKLMDTKGNSFQGTEISAGKFTFSNSPVVGKSYKLQILLGSDTYESEILAMPPIAALSNFYSERAEKKEYQSNSSGVPVAVTVTGQELYADAPVTAALANYRFVARTVMEWVYVIPNTPMAPTMYGWQSLYDKSTYNIAGPKKFSQISKIEKQPLMLLPFNTTNLIRTGASVAGWIFILDQYGTSQSSYDYHEKLNNQFSANGSLFDPVQTQVYGNIICKTDPAKIVFGFFDLASYQQHRYFIQFNGSDPAGSALIRKINGYPAIPENGQTINVKPGWWE